MTMIMMTAIDDDDGDSDGDKDDKKNETGPDNKTE